jgi:O-antigen/teichoic acid export membrane protein
MRIVRSIKNKINNLMPRASFARNVGILAGGTAIAQALTVLALPIITRLYTPEDFSVLAVYTALLSIIGVVACLRFEIAIPLPNDDFEAANLLILGVLFNTAISLIVLLLVAFMSVQIANGIKQPALEAYLWLLPVGVWLTGSFGCVQFWATRRKLFSDIAQTRMTQSLSSVFAQVIMGWSANTGPLGLLIGQLTGSVVGLNKLARLAWQDIRMHKKKITPNTLGSTFQKNSNFAKYSTFESLANVGTEQLPIIIIAVFAVGPEAGFALLAMKAAAVPVSLIGGSISQVYLSRASDEFRTGKLPEFTQKIMAGLVGAGVGPLMCIGILAPDFLPLIFGAQWTRTGEIVAWMTPWFILQFLASPISMALHVTANQRLAMFNQAWGFALRVGMTVWAAIYLNKYVVEIYAISGILFYLGYLLIVLHISSVGFLSLVSYIKSKLKIVLAWVIIACFLKLVIN